MTTQTSPNAADIVTESIRQHRKDIGGRYFTEHYTERATVGQFTAVADATVEVQVLVKFDKKYVYAPPNSGDERRVQVSASAKCYGHGCVDPDHAQPFTDAVSLDTDADRTAETALPLVQRAREWAQAHSEKCRAQTYRR